MGQYKVPQDVEAEDKLIGPLSLRQFIYVVIGIAWAGLMWLLLNKFIVIMILLILPITGFFLLLGFGRRQEQSFETYFLAVIKFLVEPRIRIWDKDLSQDELIKHTEKPVEIIPSKTLNRGSLNQLALIMDTHGTQKDPTIQLQEGNDQASMYGQRVISPTQSVGGVISASPQIKTTQTDDVLDVTNEHNTQVGEMLENVEANIHSKALSGIQSNLNYGPSPANHNVSQLQTSSAIIKRAMLQGNNLTVEQIAKESNQNIIPEGQSINISPSN